MTNVSIDLSKIVGKIKPMHAVNNAPSCSVGNFNGTWEDQARDKTKKRNGNLEEYKAAGILYARTHDASFYAKYGGAHTVDVAATHLKKMLS